MKALRLHPPGNDSPRFRLDEVPVPQPAPHELLVRVSFSGLGGRDYDTSLPADDSPPVIVGEEFSGIVAGYGAGLPQAFRDAFPVGSAVTGENANACGACEGCRSGRPEFCGSSTGAEHLRKGAHAEYLAVPALACWNLQPIVDKISLEPALRHGAVAAPYGIAYRALLAGGHAPAERTLILGGGTAGLAALDLARACGAADLHLLEIDPARRQVAREIGAALVLAPEDAGSLPVRYDRVIVAGGSEATLALLGREHLAAEARIVFLSGPGLSPEAAADLSRTGASQYFLGGRAGGSLERVIRLLANQRLRPDLLAREVISLEQALLRLAFRRQPDGRSLVRLGNA